jgi:hypothetical protein
MASSMMIRGSDYNLAFGRVAAAAIVASPPAMI